MTTSVKTDRFVAVVSGLLERARDMVERAGSDRIAARDLCDLLETASNLIDDHTNPKPRGYADVLVTFNGDNA